MANLTAAAQRFIDRRLRRGRNATPDKAWQLAAWGFYRRVPEVYFSAAYNGHAMARARLFAGRRADDGTIEPAPDDHPATEIVSQIAGGPDGQSKLLGAFGKHLTIAGEGWVVVRPNSEVRNPDVPEDGHDWLTLSVREVEQQNGKLSVQIDGEDIEIPAGDPDTLDPQAPVALRVWTADPERAIEADSPVRSSLGLLEELELLNAAVKAIARSRLTGRGILLVPKGVRFPTKPGQSDAEDDLIEMLMTVAETAIREPDSAAATIPIVLEVPSDSIASFKLITFESEFDELAIKLREEAIRRYATGLEMPAEILLGMGDINHWGAWQLTEEAISLGIEPKLATVAHALTLQWLRPLLQAERVPDWHRWLVWYDTAPLRVRSNRSQVALETWDRGLISDTAARRETGFDDADAPDTPPKRPKARTEPQDDDTSTPEVDLPVDETNSEPDTLPASLAYAPPIDPALLAAADGLIWAALSAAGEKLRRTPACPRSERARARELQPAQLHTILIIEQDEVDRWRLLDGAWARLPEVADRYGVDPDCLTAALDTYARELITAGVEHSYDLVPSALHPCTAAREAA
ncbi:hypothetical protein [Streptomyces sp. NRRL B-1347]|uniref:hypothetical protein n=1 Tax=Streptomyces sp. NRRL B-1347 TaxID=1476877 RepID=UPI0004C9A146|nr:hypothetical protein [Streptomyces sp. NRRL B-1347]